MDIEGYRIRPSKHFVLGWMRKWDYTTDDLRSLIENAYEVKKVGKWKYESFTRTKGKSRKLIFLKDEENREFFIITGAEGT